MSALPPTADIRQCAWNARKVPLTDIAAYGVWPPSGRLNVPHPDEGMRVYIVAYDTTKPTQITIAASAKPTTAEVHMLSS
jgi:hypothetical protein